VALALGILKRTPESEHPSGSTSLSINPDFDIWKLTLTRANLPHEERAGAAVA
jgi:hypothetical protein